MSEIQNLSSEQLIQMLAYVLSGDNAKIQEATKILKVYTKGVQSIPTLALIISQHQNDQYRQLSAVLLRRNMAANFSKLDEQSQSELKTMLVQRFFAETVNVIRTNIGQLIGTIAQQTLGENKWPELYQILQTQTAKTQDLITRQRGLVLLSLVFDYSGDSLKPFYSAFFPFFVENLQDQDKQIRVQTVKCLISLFDNIEHMDKNEAQQYKTLVEPILRFVDSSIKEGDEDNAYHCFDAFGYLAESKLTILDTHLGLIIEYAAGQNLLLNPKCSSKFKECVIDFIYSVIETHKKVLAKNQNLLKQLVECLCLVIAQPFSQNDLESDEDPIQDVALWLVETLTIQIGKKKPLYNLFLQAITTLINSNDANQMNAAFLILAAITEGLQDLVRRSLQNPIMNVLIPKGLADQRVEVRGSAIKCLSYFSEWVCPEILNYDKVIIPEMINGLQSQSHKVQEKALLTIDIFAENMDGDKIQPYLQSLLPILVQVFLLPTTTFFARKLCLSSIGSIITSSKEHFAVYVKDVSDLLLKVIAERDTPEITSIKAEAIQVIGKMSEAFKENQEVQDMLITPLAPQIYKMLTENNDNEIREACLSFFYNMASAQGQKFAPIFTQIIDFTVQLAKSNEGITYDKNKKAEFSLDSDSDSEADQGPMKVKVSQMDEKAAALHALGQFAMSVPQLFGNYYKPVLDILEETTDYFYENIRLQTIQCYRDLIESYIRHKNGGQLPQFTPGLPCIETFDQEFANLLQLDIFLKFIKIIVEDESVECVALAIDAINDLCLKVGPQIVHKNMNDLTKALLLVLTKKIKCLGADEEEEFEENDEDDMNETIFENISELIPTLAKTLKNGFLLSFRELLPTLLQFFNKDKDINEIIDVVGSFAQIFENEPSLIFECQQTVVPFLLSVPEIGDVELNRNSAYALATFCEFGQEQDVLAVLPKVLQTIRTIYDASGSYKEAQENATAAICRIVMRFPQALPLAQTLDSILQAVPFTADVQENFTVIRFLLHMGNTQPELIQGKMDIVIKLLIDSTSQKDKYNLDDKQFTIVINAIKGLIQNAQYKTIIEGQLMAITEESRRNKVIQLLQ